MRSDGRRVTSADVAREVGVSRTTVSFVLNDTPHQHLGGHAPPGAEAADRLHYSPSAAARALRSGRSELVLYFLPSYPIGPATTRQIELLATRLAERGLTLVLHRIPSNGQAAPADLLRAVTPAAAVSSTALPPEVTEAFRRAQIPVVIPYLEGEAEGEGVMGGVQERVGRLQVEHLAVAGHRRLGHAQTDEVDSLAGFALPRLEGVRRECLELGLPQPVVRTVGLDCGSAADAVRDWRAAAEPPTAICAYNDDVAFAVLAGMARHGLRAPDDLAVIGVDDIPLAPVAVPPLTTVVVDSDPVTDQIIDAVVRAVSGRRPLRGRPSDVVRLVRRESA